MPENHSPTADSTTGASGQARTHLDALSSGYRQLVTMKHQITPPAEVNALFDRLREAEDAAAAHGATPAQIAAAIRHDDTTPIRHVTIAGLSIPILSLAQTHADRVETAAAQRSASLRTQTKNTALRLLSTLYRDLDALDPTEKGRRGDHYSNIAAERCRALDNGAIRTELLAAVTAGITAQTPTGPTTAAPNSAPPGYALAAAITGFGAGDHHAPTEPGSTPTPETSTEPAAHGIGL
ncbi:hypothetical protein ACIGO9_30050 [Nocardia asteroides]|uniref:hypothetical protein n=1 Tax=Nocardia asteroides TaxID=1824 RepID=UPI0037CB78CB